MFITIYDGLWRQPNFKISSQRQNPTNKRESKMQFAESRPMEPPESAGLCQVALRGLRTTHRHSWQLCIWNAMGMLLQHENKCYVSWSEPFRQGNLNGKDSSRRKHQQRSRGGGDHRTLNGEISDRDWKPDEIFGKKSREIAAWLFVAH